jgi:hypothetical protein
MGTAARTPHEVATPLEDGPRHHFAAWPNRDIPFAPAGVYTVWQGDIFIYVGMAGRSMGVDPKNPPSAGTPTTKPKNPLQSRPNAHALGRRSGDQFCVYACDRFVVPDLNPLQLEKVAEGKLKLDVLTKQYIRDNYDYSYITDLGGYTALQIERVVQRGTLSAGKPYLNPK